MSETQTKFRIFCPNNENQLLNELVKCQNNRKITRISVFGSMRSFNYPQLVMNCGQLRQLKKSYYGKTSEQTQVISESTYPDQANWLLIDTRNMNQIISLDQENRILTVGGGITIQNACEYLGRNGLALENISAYDQITVSGASSNCTHGSGTQNFASIISSIEIIKINGEKLFLTDPKFFTHLGVLGIITKISLKCVPIFSIKQSVYYYQDWKDLSPHLDQIIRSTDVYSVMLRVQISESQILSKTPVIAFIRKQIDRPVTNEQEKFDEKFLSGNLLKNDLVRNDRGLNCSIEKTSCVDTYYNIIVDHTTVSQIDAENVINYTQSEIFIPMKYSTKAIDRLIQLAEVSEEFQYVLPSGLKLRFVRSDQQLMSTFNSRYFDYQTDCFLHTDFFLAIQLSMYGEPKIINEVLSQIETTLRCFPIRTHWGQQVINISHNFNSFAENAKIFNQFRTKIDPEDQLIVYGSQLEKLFNQKYENLELKNNQINQCPRPKL